MLVVDASATIPFVLADEARHRLPIVANAMRNGTCLVPALWSWEMANLLWKVVRVGRVKETELARILHDIAEFDVRIETESIDQTLNRTLMLASRHDLTAYDAAYLEVALRMQTELATFDSDLRKAALAEGIVVHSTP